MRRRSCFPLRRRHRHEDHCRRGMRIERHRLYQRRQLCRQCEVAQHAGAMVGPQLQVERRGSGVDIGFGLGQGLFSSPGCAISPMASVATAVTVPSMRPVSIASTIC